MHEQSKYWPPYSQGVLSFFMKLVFNLKCLQLFTQLKDVVY